MNFANIRIRNRGLFFPSLLTVASLVLGGCDEAIETLIEAGKDETAKAEQLKKEEAAYQGIKKAIENHQLKMGVSDKEIQSRYGSPMIVRREGENQSWIYKPAEDSWFKGPKIRLYFDEASKLVRIECRELACGT